MLCVLSLLLGTVIPDRSIGTHRAIESAAWSPDGGRVTTGDRDGYVVRAHVGRGDGLVGDARLRGLRGAVRSKRMNEMSVGKGPVAQALQLGAAAHLEV